MYSAKFALHYDALMSDYSTLTATIKKLIKYTLPPKQKIRLLELACGTGTILQKFPKSYDLYGLDLSENMLEFAKKKVPYATFIHADMTDFQLKEKFDVILCVFDSLNHLTKFSQWKKVFKNVSKHLEPNGVFIFDMNTQKRLTTLATFPPYIKKLDKHTIVIEKLSQKNNLFSLKIDILENITSDKISLHEEIVNEIAFETEKVQQALSSYFRVEKMLDPFRKRVTKNTGRIFFACRKLL